MKILKWVGNNILFVVTLFLLAFIPLYPKLPLIGVTHTFVYIRLDDFAVSLAILLWLIELFRKKTLYKTPLTVPILIFWFVGLVSTLYAVIFLFPHLANIFPNVAYLTYLRHIEYILLFFVAYGGIKDRRFLPYLIWTLALTMILVVLYGVGQKFLGFPAYLTMNEEFAKGIPLRLSAASRIPSTFAGHYDLAAWLILVIPLLGSMIFGYKNKWAKVGLILTGWGGLTLLLYTASRVSFVVYLIAVVMMLILQKQKRYIIPFVLLSVVYLNLFQGISARFGSTISSVDLVVDARTGKPVGVANKNSQKKLIIEQKDLTGENLPQGSGYISLPSTPTKSVTQVTYKRTQLKGGTELTEQKELEGQFVVKQALAYDVSFTTRFQGEWPRALDAFNRNIFLGSGYSSISLATDNNYLRMLGETGLLGLLSFIFIFIIASIYIAKVFPFIESPTVRSLAIGFTSGVVGLFLNAILIDVFEASKVAYVLWLLMGATLGFVGIFKKHTIRYIIEIKNLFLSPFAFVLYAIIGSFAVFSIIVNNFFVADDFTWLHWAATCKRVLFSNGLTGCEPINRTIVNYFLHSDGFFYRPGTKTYFFFMYAFSWLSPISYHVVSIIMHGLTAALVFLVSLKILKNRWFAVISGFVFLVMSAHTEAVLWISSTGSLFASFFVLLALLLYIYWRENEHWSFLVLSVISAAISVLFHEFGVVTPFLIVAYDLFYTPKYSLKEITKKKYLLLLFIPLPIYYIMRIMAKSLWFFGDYSYNIAKLPFNFIGNAIGYFGLALFGVGVLPFFTNLRIAMRQNLIVPILLIAFSIIVTLLLFQLFKYNKKLNWRVIGFSLCAYIICLLPFLGLGNIAPRYDYLSSFGVALLLSYILSVFYMGTRKLGKTLSVAIMILLVVLYSIVNIYAIRRVNNYWKNAGMITNNLLVALNNTYAKTRAATGNPVFYFADVPIKQGEAWVFPVGLSDAVWFDFQSENLNVHQATTLEQALNETEGSASAKVFDFNKDGSIEQVVRTKTTTQVPLNQ